MSIWDNIKNFSKKDNWGEAEKISPKLLYKVDALRDDTGSSIIVSCGTQGVHAKDSQHYLGKAADILCPALDLFEFYLLAEAVGFRGLGLYPDWRLNGKVTGGLHVDVRKKQLNESGARWIGYAGQYYALTVENLKRFKVI